MQRILLVWWANFGTDAITLDGWLLGAWTLGWVIMKGVYRMGYDESAERRSYRALLLLL